MSQLLSKNTLMQWRILYFTITSLSSEVFLEFFDMETILKVSSQKHATREPKQHFDNMLEQFVNYHVFRLGVTVDDKV